MANRYEHIERVIAQALPVGKILLCISGGADSMALLHACKRIGAHCVTVHCDFHLRAQESERDRRFVAWVCRCLGVECVQVHFDVPKYMEANKVSVEMACRELRYREFRKLKQELGCVRIVTAHNRDDNDETMLLNLFRGTGVKGLCGMEADNGEILRPLLEVSRSEIENYLHAIGARHITDSSNLSEDYRRNFIRHSILPLIASRWPGIHKSLARTRRNMCDAHKLCENIILQDIPDTPDFLSADIYNRTPSKALLLMKWLEGKGATPSQIDEISFGLRPGCSWQLKDCTLTMLKDGLHLIHTTSSEQYTLSSKPLTPELMQHIRSRRGDEVLYYSGGEPLTFRPSRPGERMAPFGMKGTKLISDLLREGGIPSPCRDTFLIAVDGKDRVIWLPGIRRSRHLCINPDTDKTVYILSKNN